MASVYIPVQNSEEEVRVVLDQLPRDASDIIDILKAEQAPLNLWLIIAREYFKQGKVEQFRQILEEGSSPDIDEYYADVRYERIAILNALGAYYCYLGKIETRHKEREEYFIQATRHYNKASRIDMHEPSTWIGKGQLLLAKGDLEQASSAFRIVLDGDRDNVPALLGQACVEFNRGSYSESLSLYRRVLRIFPDCPGPVRLGIGQCQYKMGRFEKARKAFERVVQLDPDNVEALVALAILDLQTNEAARTRNGMERMKQAFEIYPYCPMALNYLANHFFFTGQHFLVEQLMETALAVTNHGPTKSHSYYNLARCYHSKGDYKAALRYYRASVQEINKPSEFVFPYFGLGQVQLKLGDTKSAVSNFEKVLEVYQDNCDTLKVLGHVNIGQPEKAKDFLKKATKIDPRDAQAFLDLGELLITSDTAAALDSFKTASKLMKKQEVPVEVLNNIGVIHFEREELEDALVAFKEALGDGLWLSFLDGKRKITSSVLQYKDVQLFHQLEEDGVNVELPWNKVTPLFNLARLLEQLHKTETAGILYRLILFKYPDYVDGYLRLAAIAKSRNNLHLSIELVNEALKLNNKCPNALSMLGELELKNDDWVKAKETLRAASDAMDGKDSYSTLALGNWNYFAALRNEKRNPKLESTHLEKAKELYSKVLVQHTSNLYAANGAGIVLAEKGNFDVAKDLFTQVQEGASGSSFVQLPDVWINLAHVYFAQGNNALAIKMYQNCLRKYYHNTDYQILLYMARTYYEAEQWQDCKKTLLRAIHLAPSNYTLRFDTGVAMQKFSASTLQKTKRTVDEVRSTVDELENAVRVFSQLSAGANLQIHGFDEKKINTHVEYCKHLLEAAKVHREAAEREEQQNKQRQEVARQMALAEEARRKAEEQRKAQMERRKIEDERKRIRQQEENFQRVKDQWKSSSAVKRKDRLDIIDDEEVGQSGVGRRRKKGGKRRKKEKSSKSQYDKEEGEADMDDHEEGEMHDSYGQNRNDADDAIEQGEDQDQDQDLLAAAGLEDSDADDEEAAAAATAARRRRALSESEEDEPAPVREDSNDMQLSDGEVAAKDAGPDDED
ncbi:Protein CTR9 homolog [Linum grandiflorum]